MPRARSHNEWFMPVQKQAYGKGSRCPCGKSRADRVKEGMDPQMYAWGEYHNAKWRCVDYFCQACFAERVLQRLKAHTDPCGCTVNFNARSGHGIAEWITAGQVSCNKAA